MRLTCVMVSIPKKLKELRSAIFKISFLPEPIPLCPKICRKKINNNKNSLFCFKTQCVLSNIYGVKIKKEGGGEVIRKYY